MKYEIITCTAAAMQEYMKELLEINKSGAHEYWAEEHFKRPLNMKFDLSKLLLIENKLAGYLIASDKQGVAHIHKLMITEERQREGWGTKLYHAFRQDACHIHGYSSVSINAYKSNVGAIKLYERMGFKQVGERIDTINGNVITALEWEI